MSKSLLIGVFCLVLTGCASTGMQLAEPLHHAAQPHQVEGRSGWWIDQQLRFGGFTAGPVRRGWTRGYDYPFLVRFTGAREKLRFSVSDANGLEASVFCAGKLREQDLRLFREYFDISLRAKDHFVGTVGIAGTAAPYDFQISDLELQQNPGYRAMRGAIRGGGTSIELRSVWHLASGQRTWGTEPLGVEFLLDGRVVAAVETLNEGRVWLHDDLDREKRLVLASVASALLLRSELSGHNDG